MSHRCCDELQGAYAVEHGSLRKCFNKHVLLVYICEKGSSDDQKLKKIICNFAILFTLNILSDVTRDVYLIIWFTFGDKALSFAE